jgi:hypothetical protein
MRSEASILLDIMAAFGNAAMLSKGKVPSGHIAHCV